METLLCANAPNGSCKCSACKCTFLKPGHRVEKFEKAALVFSFGQRIRIICESMTPLPHPLRQQATPKPAVNCQKLTSALLGSCPPMTPLPLNLGEALTCK